MGESPVFEWVAAAVERKTPLSRLQARGTVRLTLKHAGLEPGTVTLKQMAIVVPRLLPAALGRLHVTGAEEVCRAIAAELEDAPELRDLETRESAYDVFRRFGRDPTEGSS